MSQAQSGFRPGFTTEATRDRKEIKKNADEMYKNSFGDLPEDTIYRDPLGVKAGESVTLQKDRWEQLNNQPVQAFAQPHVAGDNRPMSVVEKFNELQRKGYDLEDTFTEIRKSLDTGDWTLPVDIIPEVFTVNPERLPMADLLPRVTTQDDEVTATPLDAHPNIHWGLESTASTDGDGNRVYEYEDPTFGDHSFTVEGYGAATRISDKMILSSANLRNAESAQEQAFVRAMRQEEERQIILGTNNDASGFDGFDDFISNGDGEVIGDLGDPSSTSPSDYEDATRELVDDAEYEGADYDNLAVVCGFDWHRQLRESLTDNVRYEPMADQFGISSVLDFDGVPVFKTHAITREQDLASTTTNTQAYTVNMNATYLSMLQEANVRPLARLGPQSRFGIDAYGTLVSEENGAHIRGYSVTTT